MSRGHDRERQVRKVLEEQGWWVGRCAGSLGDADLVALRAEYRDDETISEARLIEVKSSPYPFAHFGPQDRAELLEAAQIAGAEPVLAHWPPRGKLRFIYVEDWPEVKVAA